MIGSYAATQLASLSLVINLIRELVSLLLCAPLSRRGKSFAAISLAGINSMDVCHPSP